MHLFDRIVIKRLIPQSYQRGSNYFLKGKVQDASIIFQGDNHLSVSGDVKGTESEPYSVSIDVLKDTRGRIRIEGNCTCPVGYNCKHVVALLLQIIEDEKHAMPQTRDIQSRTSTKQAQSISSAELGSSLLSWLKNLDTAITDPNDYPSHINDRILYVLALVTQPSADYQFDKVYLQIDVMRATLRKNSTYGYVKLYRKSNQTQAFVRPVDKTIFERLEQLQGTHKSENILRGHMAIEVLKQMISTQRCHWLSKNNPPLSLAEGRSAETVWQLEEEGKQRLVFQINGQTLTVLPLSPLFYVDTITWEVGELNTSLSEFSHEFELAVLDMPAVKILEAEQLYQQLVAKNINVPKPQPLKIVHHKDIEPVIHLTLSNQYLDENEFLSSGKSRSKNQSLQAAIPMLILSFDYHGIKVSEMNRGNLESYNEQTQTINIIELNRITHKQAKERLILLGFVPIYKSLFFMSNISDSHSYHRAIQKLGPEKSLQFVPDPLAAVLVHKNSKVLEMYCRSDDIQDGMLTMLQVDEILNLAEDEDSKPLSPEELNRLILTFNMTEIPKLRVEGWSIKIDEDYLFQVIDPTLIDEWYAEIDETTGVDWFGLELGIMVDNEKLPLLPILTNLLKKLKNSNDLSKLTELPDDTILTARLEDGRILPLSLGRIREILNVLIELSDSEPLDEEGKLRLAAIQAARLVELEAAMCAVQLRWLGGNRLLELGRKLQNFQGIKPVSMPNNFNTELRPYQQEGLNWLQFLQNYNLNGILADDMGLGKTVQSLSHILTEKQNQRLQTPCLIVAPTSLMVNWKMEAQRFAPDLKVLILHGPERKRYFDQIANYDIVLTTYPLLTRDKNYLLKHHFHLLILDEAQNIKNPKTKSTQLVHQLRATHRLCLTGTPMENHLGELWSLFHFLMPGLLGDYQSFRYLFRNPIEKENDLHRQAALARRIKPFLLRRTKEEVVKELPEKNEMIRTIELEGTQRDLYETIRVMMHEKVRKEVASKGLARSQIIVLDALLKLRQVCCDPRLVKLESAKKVKQSAKLNLLMNMLPEMVEEGRKILLFSQFSSMLKLIEQSLDKTKLAYVTLTGQTRKRGEIIQAFQEGNIPIFLISLKAGGTGLNLTAADTVIHYDPWWNPAVENQATDRAHRIGQEKKVFVYKLLTAGTVEEKIQELQARKKQLTDALFNGKDKGNSTLSQTDLEALFQPLGTFA